MTTQSGAQRRPVARTRQPMVVNAIEIDAEGRRTLPIRSFNRVSLRAILAGMIIALIVMVAMSILGLAIGATTLDAMIDFDSDPVFDPETGVIVWMAVTNLIALFLGGWVAGRLAGVPDELDGLLHGLLTWGAVTLVSLWLFTSVTGQILNGAANGISLGFDAIGAGVETVVPAASDAIQRQDVALEDIRDEARNLAADTGDPALQPDALDEQGDEAGDIVGDTARDIAQNPSSAGARIERAIDRLLALDAPREADREDVVNVIVANTDLTEEEAREVVNSWETQYNDIEIDVEEIVNNASEDVTEAIALAAGVVFMSMVLGAVAGGAGGYLGTPTLAEIKAIYTDEKNVSEE